MALINAREIKAKLDEFGPWPGNPARQLYLTGLNGDYTQLQKPGRVSAVDADGNRVNSDENLEVPGRRFVPVLTTVPAQYMADYLAKGFELPPEEAVGEEPATKSLEELTVSQLKGLLTTAGVDFPVSANKAELVALAETAAPAVVS